MNNKVINYKRITHNTGVARTREDITTLTTPDYQGEIKRLKACAYGMLYRLKKQADAAGFHLSRHTHIEALARIREMVCEGQLDDFKEDTKECRQTLKKLIAGQQDKSMYFVKNED